jgi:hypothetical protein
VPEARLLEDEIAGGGLDMARRDLRGFGFKNRFGYFYANRNPQRKSGLGPVFWSKRCSAP